MARDRLGRDFFPRGLPEAVSARRRVRHTATVLDLMQAYAHIRTRDEFSPLSLKRDEVYTMEQALERMKGLIGHAADWGDIAQFLPEEWRGDPARRRSALSATFAASLELAKLGQVELRQDEMFAPVMLRRKGAAHGH